MTDKMQLLFQKFLKGSAVKEEKEALADLVAKESDDTLTDLLKSGWEQTDLSEKGLSDEEAQKVLQNILTPGIEEAPIYKIPFYKKPSFRVAASVILLVGVFAIIKLTQQKNIEPPLGSDPVASIIKNDVAPGGNKATLQLADGSTIILDNVDNGNVANQGQTKIIKIDGQLAYNADGSSKEILYNTISTPRGGQYQLILADGTKVWLNAASSLRFPTNFIGKERKVTLTGEGYFEVAKNAAMPFKVDVAGKEEVKVLGTHFNINAYEDEANIKTSLLEGSVEVTSIANKNSSVLTPGQQILIKTSGQIKINNQVDLEQVVAWKNGIFQFGDEMDIHSVMKQISRWYDLEVTYKGAVSGYIGGAISRNVNVSKVLDMLEIASELKFEVKGKKVLVLPK